MLAGPKEMTQREVLEYVLHTANMGEKSIISMPAQMAQMLGKINKLGFNPWFTDDNIAQMLEDNVLTGDMLRGDANTGNGEENVFTFADLGIEPSHMEKVTYEYLHRFRKGGHFTTVQGYH